MEIEIIAAAQWVLYVTEITSTLVYLAAIAAVPALAIGWVLVGRRPGEAGRFWRAARWWIVAMFWATVALSATEAARQHDVAGLAAVAVVAVGMAIAWHRHMAKSMNQGSWPDGQKHEGTYAG
jgi:hypothetical protein